MFLKVVKHSKRWSGYKGFGGRSKRIERAIFRDRGEIKRAGENNEEGSNICI